MRARSCRIRLLLADSIDAMLTNVSRLLALQLALLLARGGCFLVCLNTLAYNLELSRIRKKKKLSAPWSTFLGDSALIQTTAQRRRVPLWRKY